MHHLKKKRKLNKTTSHRKAMLGNLAMSILEHHRVETGHEKALEVRRVVERLITYGKKGDIHNIRLAAKIINRKDILDKLFKEIAPKFQDRNGGYTRVLKKGFRKGDNAQVSIIELVGLEKVEKVVEEPSKDSKKEPSKDKKKEAPKEVKEEAKSKKKEDKKEAKS